MRVCWCRLAFAFLRLSVADCPRTNRPRCHFVLLWLHRWDDPNTRRYCARRGTLSFNFLCDAKDVKPFPLIDSLPIPVAAQFRRRRGRLLRAVIIRRQISRDGHSHAFFQSLSHECEDTVTCRASCVQLRRLSTTQEISRKNHLLTVSFLSKLFLLPDLLLSLPRSKGVNLVVRLTLPNKNQRNFSFH